MTSPTTQDRQPDPVRAETLSGAFDEAPSYRGATVTAPARPATVEPPQGYVVPRTPCRFGTYDLLSEIARGGMGIVYRARQQGLDRHVALKMILHSWIPSEEDVRRFRAEAAAAARLEHPGIVPIHEVGEVGEQHFYSMALVEGGSLRDLVKAGPVSSRRAAELIRAIADAVRYAHARNVLHRDLKPSNVLLDDEGRPRITDFGLARIADEDSGLTRTGVPFGTPSYMPPEQADGNRDGIGPLADIYGLGAILYFLLTGQPPFRGRTVPETLRKVVEEQPVAPRRHVPSIDLDLETICLKCLEKDPERRYASAAHLVEELDRYLDGRQITARPLGRTERLRRWCRRSPGQAMLVGGLVLSILLGIAGTTTFAILMARQAREAIDAKAIAESALQESEENEYAAIITSVDHLSDARDEIGWSTRGLVDLGRAASLDVAARDDVVLRTLAARCLGAFDVQPLELLAGDVHIGDLEFSANGRLYAAESKEQPTCKIHEFDVATRSSLSKYEMGTIDVDYFVRMFNGKKFQSGFRAVAVDPTGRWVAGGTRFGKVLLWRTGESRPARVLEAHADEVHHLRFTPDGQTLVSTPKLYEPDGCELRIWRLVDDVWTEDTVVAGIGTRIDLHPDGRRLVHSYRGRLGLYDLVDRRELGWVDGVRGGSPSFSANGDRLLVEDGHRLIAFATESRKEVVEHTPDTSLTHAGDRLRVLGDGRFVVATSDEDDRLRVHDLVTGTTVATVVACGRHNAPFAVSPDGRYLAVAEKLGVRLYEVRTPTVETRRFDGEPGESDGDTSRRERLLAQLSAREPNHEFGPIEVAPDGERVWGVVDEMQLTSWTLPACRAEFACLDALHRLHAGDFRIRCLAVGERIVVAGESSGGVVLYAANPPEMLRRMPADAGEVSAVALGPDEDWCVAGTDRGGLFAWRTDGALLAEAEAPGGAVNSVVLIDETHVATADRGGFVTLWEIDGDWQEVMRFGPYGGEVHDLRANSSGHHLTATTDGGRTKVNLDLAALERALEPLGIATIGIASLAE